MKEKEEVKDKKELKDKEVRDKGEEEKIRRSGRIVRKPRRLQM